MKTTFLLTLVCALAVIPAGANANALVPEQISTEARELKTLANDVAEQLKNKRADMGAAASSMEKITERAGRITRLVGEFESSGPSLNARGKQELERLKHLSLTLNVFVDNKKQILAGDNAAAQRQQLRSQAVGVAIRADLIEKSIRKLGE